MNAALTFEHITVAVVDRDGQRWITLADATRAIYGIPQGGDSSVLAGQGGDSSGPTFENAERAMQRVFKRHAAEFTPSMTALVDLHTAGGKQQVRIFSLRGAHLLGLLARTKRAAAFRRWVLDLLEEQTHVPAEALARLQAAEHAEAESFAAARRASLAMHRRRHEKPRLLAEVEQARAEVQLALPLQEGAGHG